MAHPELARSGHVVIGVDTHKHIHVAAVMDPVGGILATLTIPTEQAGYRQLLEWGKTFGNIIAFGIEGTGSYGSALASFLRRAGHKVVEVSRPDRRLRRMNGKSDTMDAANAARAVLAGFATAVPKTADGTVEMIRQLKVAHDTAVKDRAATMVTLKAMLVHATDELRRQMAGKSRIMLARHLAALRPRGLETVDDANRHALRSLARRWQALNDEAAELAGMIEELVKATAPQLLERFGIGADTAAEILIVAGDNPERITSDASSATSSARSTTSSKPTSEPAKSRVDNYRSINALAEAVNNLYKTELIRQRGPWRTVEQVELATLEYVWWWNNQRLHGELGMRTPIEVEDAYYADHESAQSDPVGQRNR
jgi:transposase